MTMIAAQVMGNDMTIAMGGASGNFELNVYKPVIVYNLLQSIRLLADGCRSFGEKCVAGISADTDIIEAYLHNSLMLVTALSPQIGYDKSAKIAHEAHHQGITLKEAAVSLGYLTADQFNQMVRPEKMIGPNEQNR